MVSKFNNNSNGKTIGAVERPTIQVRANAPFIRADRGEHECGKTDRRKTGHQSINDSSSVEQG